MVQKPFVWNSYLFFFSFRYTGLRCNNVKYITSHFYNPSNFQKSVFIISRITTSADNINKRKHICSANPRLNNKKEPNRFCCCFERVILLNLIRKKRNVVLLVVAIGLSWSSSCSLTIRILIWCASFLVKLKRALQKWYSFSAHFIKFLLWDIKIIGLYQFIGHSCRFGVGHLNFWNRSRSSFCFSF